MRTHWELDDNYVVGRVIGSLIDYVTHNSCFGDRRALVTRESTIMRELLYVGSPQFSELPHAGGNLKNHLPAVQGGARALVGFLCAIGWAAAQAESDDSAFVYSSQLNLTSDYVGRGLSQMWGKPAVHATLAASHRSGAYASFFVSNVSDKFIPDAALESDFTLGYRAAAGGVEFDTGGVLIVYPGSNYADTSASPRFRPSVPTSVELFLGATWSGLNAKLGYIPTKFFGWDTNNSGVGGIFNGKQPNSGLTGASRGAINVEAFYTYPLSDGFDLQALAGRGIIPHNLGINWNYGQVRLDAKLEKGWSLGLIRWITSNSAVFREYGSLTESEQNTTPSRNTVVLSLSKQT